MFGSVDMNNLPGSDVLRSLGEKLNSQLQGNPGWSLLQSLSDTIKDRIPSNPILDALLGRHNQSTQQAVSAPTGPIGSTSFDPTRQAQGYTASPTTDLSSIMKYTPTYPSSMAQGYTPNPIYDPSSMPGYVPQQSVQTTQQPVSDATSQPMGTNSSYPQIRTGTFTNPYGQSGQFSGTSSPGLDLAGLFGSGQRLDSGTN